MQPIPNPDDCTGPNYSVAAQLTRYALKYDQRHMPSRSTYTIDQFYADMNSVLIKPELINCKYSMNYWGYVARGNTFLTYILRGTPVSANAFLESAKWALSKGYDKSIRFTHPDWGPNQYNVVEIVKSELHQYYSKKKDSDDIIWDLPNTVTWREAYILYKNLHDLFEPPPAAATKSCAEVDGQTPPANEYCFVARSMQESFKARLVVPGFDGYEHKTTAVSSGMGFRKDWKSTIIFTCRAPAGQSCEGLPYADDPLGPGIDADNFELYVRCGNTINLLDVDSIDGGKSETIDVIEVTNEYPYSRNCTAKSSQPFTLRIQTTRLAK